MTIYFKDGTKAKAVQIYLSDNHITYRGRGENGKLKCFRDIPLDKIKTIRAGQVIMEAYGL